MNIIWKRGVVAAVATLALGSVARSSEPSLQHIADYREQFAGQDHGQREHWSEHRASDRYYWRPVPEWRERRSHWGGYYSAPVAERPSWQRPVFAGRGWGHRESCRIIINDRVNRWGERVQVRREVCR
jgi:hypothetical protein